MQKKQESLNWGAYIFNIILGGILALGFSLLLILLCSLFVSRGWIADRSVGTLSIICCLLGCFTGATCAIKRCKSMGLLAGIAVGGVMILLLIIIGMIMHSEISLFGRGAAELCAVVAGGVLAGMMTGKPKKRRRK